MAAAVSLVGATPHFISLTRPLPTGRGTCLFFKPPPLPARRAPPLRAHPAPRRLPTAVEEHSPRALLDALKKSLLDSLAALRKPALALLLAGALLAAGGPHDAALAASGGRVGGSAFSSRSSSPSYGYTAPAPRGGYSATPFYSPSPFVSVGPAVGIGFGGSSFFFVLVGFAAFLYLAGFLSDSPGGSVLTETEKTTVLKLQKELDQIAEKADTSTPTGLSYVLTETTLALLRHPDCCISANSVITILVAAEGVHKLPSINSSSDLKTALQKLAIPSSKILAVEVLWTPQNENDTLSERELLEDYPLLRPL
ncbi:hypothetical protein GUJ93_ZPchr0013g34652 [Zizania palustris]|uniref:Uncharacterized protein n=1 Tax=Zizania palustris TaxID=103762 RepID=A0A8J6C010_ZIZPA|nr:hypothetical protein GUJ93_ZPchr0013g34652 [Zizania palustris]